LERGEEGTLSATKRNQSVAVREVKKTKKKVGSILWRKKIGLVLEKNSISKGKENKKSRKGQ
jgi:hypothetical protein